MYDDLHFYVWLFLQYSLLFFFRQTDFLPTISWQTDFRQSELLTLTYHNLSSHGCMVAELEVGFHGSRLVFMVFHSSSWFSWFFIVPLGFHGFSWFQVGFRGFSWFQVGFHGFSWLQVGFHGFS